MSVRLSVIIPIHRSEKRAMSLERALADGLVLPEGVEILFVFNPSASGRGLPLSAHPALRFLYEGVAGVNRARNRGADAASGSWLYFLDADCWPVSAVPFADVLSRLPELDRQTIYGGSYELVRPTSEVSEAYHALQDKWLRDGEHPQYGWVHLLGGNFLVSQETYAQQRFDEEIVFGGAETDFLCKWIVGGRKGSYLPDIPVWHAHRLTGGQFARKAFFQGHGFERLQQRGLLVQKFKRSLLRRPEGVNIDKWLLLYDQHFAAGRQCFRDYGLKSPNLTKRLWSVLKMRLIDFVKQPSRLGPELDRLFRSRAKR